MTTRAPGMLDAADEALEALDRYGTWRPYQRAAILIVGGALVRTLRKRYGSDSLTNVDDALVSSAYANEQARVIRGWPSTRDIVPPTTFFGTAHLLRRFFYRRGWCAKPDPLPPGALPTLQDFHPAVIVASHTGIRYASSAWLAMFGFKSGAEFVGQNEASLSLSPQAYSRLAADFETVLNRGAEITDQTYDLLSSPYAVTILRAWQVHDDDGMLLGAMCVTERAARPTSAPTDSRLNQARGVLALLVRLLGQRYAIVASVLGSMIVLTGTSDALAGYASPHLDTSETTSVAVDCNHDGIIDYLTFNSDGSLAAVIRGDKVGFAHMEAPFGPVDGITGWYVTDLDANGEPDVVLLHHGQRSFLHGLGDCVFERLDTD